MKIVQVTPRYPPHTGGVETHVKEISERLVERGHDVVVLTADATPDVNARERQNGVVVKRHRAFAPSGAFHIAPQIARSVRKEGADVVHAHNYHSLPVLFGVLGIQDEHLVITPHYHGGSADSFRNRLLSLYRPFGKWVLKRGDSIVAVSEWECEQLQSDFKIEVTIIPNGIQRERFADVKPEKRKRPYLLCVGRLEKYKGVQYAIHALAKLTGWELIVVGSGPYRSELENIADRLDVAERVTFLGYVDDVRLPPLYAGAEVFLSLSDFEAYGMTVAEALAASTPCVVYTAGALSDWVDNSGCVGIADRSPDTVTEGICIAREMVPNHKTLRDWDEIAEELETVYTRK